MILCDMKLILGPYYPIFPLETFENALYYSKQNVPPVPVHKEMTSPFLESVLVTAIYQETEDTAPPLRVSPAPGSVTEEEGEMSIAERVLCRRRTSALRNSMLSPPFQPSKETLRG